VWALYAAVTGTVATGAWVVAHECGHDAFSDNKTLQDTVGYVLHSALLVPYFSWQRSHAVHHSRTNHMEEGETHVPFKSDSAKGQANYALKEAIGEDAFAIVNLFVHLVVGWPAYLISGATGGPKYGVTNHFWPVKPFSDGLFPTDLLKKKVWLSNVGCMATLAALATWAVKAGSILPVMAVYAGPYVVTNFWLVLYTWLQHTDVDVPHFSGKEWDWVKGTFMTIDRPYPPVIDFLHHKIGTTHVAHHISHQIPHYNAQRATDAIKENFPHLYLYDPTPIAEAMIRVGKECVAAERFGDKFLFVSKKSDLQSN
jgi:omega-6 fatty acid desaturase (delta-12 desaturase)